MTERRRSERIFLRVPITVQAMDQNGQPFTEQTFTIEINRDGARIGLKNSVRLGDELRITNLATGFAALFRVCVQCPQSYGGSAEWGIAASPSVAGLMSDFWGVVFEDLVEAAQPHISALLACSLCGRQELVALSRPEYEILLQDLVFPRICTICQTSTDWVPAEPQARREPSGLPLATGGAAPPEASAPVEESLAAGTRLPIRRSPRRAGAETAEPARSIGPAVPTASEEGALAEAGLPGESTALEGEGQAAGIEVRGEEGGLEGAHQAAPRGQRGPAPVTPQTPSEAEANRRVARRVPVGVPMLIRTSDGRAEETTTRDVSRTGLSFPTLLDLNSGDRVEIVVGHGVVASPKTQEAEIVWRRPAAKGVKALAGARFTEIRERE